MITFGHVPSRRLGRSLGINNIPPKSCSYACIYCQVGPTPNKEVVPRSFYRPEEIKRAVELQLEAAVGAGERIDFLNFVPDGEPTLDKELRRTMALIRPLDIKIAIISNGSLSARPLSGRRITPVPNATLRFTLPVQEKKPSSGGLISQLIRRGPLRSAAKKRTDARTDKKQQHVWVMRVGQPVDYCRDYRVNRWDHDRGDRWRG